MSKYPESRSDIRMLVILILAFLIAMLAPFFLGNAYPKSADQEIISAIEGGRVYASMDRWDRFVENEERVAISGGKHGN